MRLHRAEWQRPSQPALSTMTTDQSWCRVQLYNPAVVRVGDTYRMWYLGNASDTYMPDMVLGLAESTDGLHWTERPENPILDAGDLPFGSAWQTPFVLFDTDESIYRMWFAMVAGRRTSEDSAFTVTGQKLGYATSRDGLSWDVYPEPVLPEGRGPCVIKDGPHSYRMWMGSARNPDERFGDLFENIYRFESADGVHWTRDPEPAVTANDRLWSVIYPFVMRDGDGYVMWYGCHVDSGVFEIYCSTSSDGLTWTHHHDAPAFGATRAPTDFDGRYVSTPCVLDDGDRYLLYYCARDWGALYRAGDGTIKNDGRGIYRHIGVAVCPKADT
jgi:hypothetical protein